MEPIWYALNSKKCEQRWDAKQRGSYKSAAAGRQFPQTRVKACGWSSHDRCLMCLQAVVALDAGGSSSSSRQPEESSRRQPEESSHRQPEESSRRQPEESNLQPMEEADGVRGRKRKNHKEKVEASDDQLARAPKGNLHHRLWKGDCLKELRHKHATKEDIDTVNSCEVAGNPAWEKGTCTPPDAPHGKTEGH